MLNIKSIRVNFYIIFLFTLIINGCNSIISHDQQNVLTNVNGNTQISDIASKMNITETYTPSVPSIKPTIPNQSITATISPTLNPNEMPNLIVVYPYENDLYILKPKKLTSILIEKIYPTNDPILISQDSKKIVYEISNQGGGREINVVNADGSDNKTLTHSDNLEPNNDPDFMGNDPYNLQWIPNTHKLLFSTVSLFVGPPHSLRHNNLFVIDVDTGEIIRIYSAGAGGDAWPSPDGKKIVVTLGNSLFLASNEWKILYKEIITYEDYSSMPSSINWSPDSSRIGTIISSNNRHYNFYARPLHYGVKASIWLIESSSGIPSLIGTIQNYGSGLLSPTLDYIGYSIMNSEYEIANTYVSSLNGTTDLLLESNSSEFISFSPDGLHFAFTANRQISKTCGKGYSQQKVYIGSLDGERKLMHYELLNGLLKWVNNSQFVYISETSIILGDINGNSTQIGTIPGCIMNVEVKNID
jgi:hypothetical protein